MIGGGGGKHFSKTFSIFYMLNSKKQIFQTIFLKRYLSNEKNTFTNNSRGESTIFLMEKLSFSLKLFLAICMGNLSLRLSEVLDR